MRLEWHDDVMTWKRTLIIGSLWGESRHSTTYGGDGKLPYLQKKQQVMQIFDSYVMTL